MDCAVANEVSGVRRLLVAQRRTAQSSSLLRLIIKKPLPAWALAIGYLESPFHMHLQSLTHACDFDGFSKQDAGMENYVT